MLHSYHLLCETSKLRNEIAEPILATLKHWNMVLKGINYCFQGKKRIPKLSKKWVFKKSESFCFCCCIIDQNSKMKLHNQYSMDSQNKDIFWKLWYISFQPTQQHPKWIKMSAIILQFIPEWTKNWTVGKNQRWRPTILKISREIHRI